MECLAHLEWVTNAVKNCVFKRTFAAQGFALPNTHGGVNAKPFVTYAGVALMYVTATARLPFSFLSELRSAQNSPTATKQ